MAWVVSWVSQVRSWAFPWVGEKPHRDGMRAPLCSPMIQSGITAQVVERRPADLLTQGMAECIAGLFVELGWGKNIAPLSRASAWTQLPLNMGR